MVSHCFIKLLSFLILLGSPLLLAAPARALVILQYHHVDDSTPKSTSVSPELFEAHLDFIEQNNFKVVSITELREYLKKKSVPDGTVIITFDDGYRSIYTEAYPRLEKRKWPFTVFINTQPHDEKNPQYIQWDELREMAKNGATIANHSDSHPHMIRRGSEETVTSWSNWRERQIDFAEQRIKKEIGKSHKLFAYPFGEYDNALEKMLERKGYLAFGQQSGPVAPTSDPQAVPRFAFGGAYGQGDDFANKLFSLPLPVTSVVLESEDGRALRDVELPKDVDIPVLRITTPLARYVKNFNCFASGQGRINTNVQSGSIIVKANRPLPPGRSRYNCTANAGNGRYYWYSQMFIRRNGDGSWYSE